MELVTRLLRSSKGPFSGLASDPDSMFGDEEEKQLADLLTELSPAHARLYESILNDQVKTILYQLSQSF
jgi:hypothetical protein